MLLMQAQENGAALDAEQLLFLAGGQDNAFNDDVDEQPVQDLALNVDNVFQADDCDVFDSDVDEASTTQTMFMANLSSADPVTDEAEPSYDSDILSEVHDHDHCQDAACAHHEEHVMHDSVQLDHVVDSYADYTSDSNMIPYDPYVKDNEPSLYNGHEIIKDNHASAIMHNIEDTLEMAQITRKKMNAKMNDPECVTRKVKITPHEYSKENFLATFTPQKQLTPEQIFWFNDLIKLKSEALKEQTTVSRPRSPDHGLQTTVSRPRSPDHGEAAFIFGIKISRDRSRRLIGLSQNAYLDKILKRYRMDNSKRGSIPMQVDLHLSKSQCATTSAEMKRMQNVPYASAVGSIRYAVRCTRPDVAFAQNITSRFQHNSGEAHWTAVKNILKYLRNTKDTFLVGGDPEAELRVNCYCDAGFKTDRDDTKSQTSMPQKLNIAASEAAKEAVWIRKFIDELGVVLSNDYSIMMNCVKSAVIIVAKESGIQKGAIHFKRTYHYVRECIETVYEAICQSSYI
nr:hypothetical protein [Tanacetum cinerariifolium]